jgi:hypothetical protein
MAVESERAIRKLLVVDYWLFQSGRNITNYKQPVTRNKKHVI